METPINPKSTKNEIIAAYEDLLKQVKDQKKDSQQPDQPTKERDKIIKAASDVSFEGIVKSIADQKINLTTSLDRLEGQLLERFKQLTQLNETVTNQEKYLNELYQIKVNIDSLAALIEAQKAKKSTFEEEMNDKRKAFEMERANLEVELKEQKDKAQRDRKREEEEYKYNLAVLRKKESDAYEEKKAKLEKELIDKRETFDREVKEHEVAMAEYEVELTDLRKRAKNFPSELEVAVKQAETALEQRLQFVFKYEKDSAAQKVESELKLRDQTISTLKEKIKEQELQIKQLAEKATSAENSVKDIAIKALESSSNVRIFEKSKEGREN